MQDQPPKTKTRVFSPLTILLIIFIIPMLLAWLFYKHPHAIQGQRSNKGDLIIPTFSIRELNVYNEQGKNINNTATKTNGKWWLLLFVPDQCDLTCAKGLYTMRQVRIAMGGEQNRVERAVLTYKNSNQLMLLQQYQFKNYPGTHLFQVEPREYQRIIKKHVPQTYALNEGTFFIVDPRGNFMMSYNPRANPMDVFNDLKYLLKVFALFIVDIKFPN